MRRSSRWTERRLGDDGSAALEFIAVGLLLLVPIVYLVVALGLIQEQSLGVEAAARHIARSVAAAPDATTARERADAALKTVVDEYGLDADAVDVSFECRPAGPSCPAAGATIVTTVTTRVTLPLVPPVLGLDRLATVAVQSSAVQKVSLYWGAG